MSALDRETHHALGRRAAWERGKSRPAPPRTASPCSAAAAPYNGVGTLRCLPEHRRGRGVAAVHHLNLVMSGAGYLALLALWATFGV